jgi:carbon-monoxide dehydrogenase large subunit
LKEAPARAGRLEGGRESSGAGRREDARFLTGTGRYTSDRLPEGCLHAHFVRSVYAHARITGIDATAARKLPGVRAVFTLADMEAAGILPTEGKANFHGELSQGLPTPRPALAGDTARYLGEPVALVIAETSAAALDGAEAVEIAWDPLPAAASISVAAAAGAPRVWEDAPDNIGFVWRGGEMAAAEQALAGAAHVTRLSCSVSRVGACPLEPRAFLAWVTPDGRLAMGASHQSPHGLRNALKAHQVDPDPHVRIEDVGGSFGMKTGLHGEGIAVAFAARKLGRPVHWESGRSEALLSDPAGRDTWAEIAIGFDAEARIVALTGRIDVNAGPYLPGGGGGAVNNIGSMAGLYGIPVIGAEIRGVLTNLPPTAAYRGAGRPEAAYYIERTLDVAARELGLDPLELRRRNLVPPERMPYRTVLTFTYDCGDFPALLKRGAAEADLAGFVARRAAAERRGRRLGLGVAACIETAGGTVNGAAPDWAKLSLLADGRLLVDPGSFSVGQGHETAFPRLVAQQLGLDPVTVLHRQGDTDRLESGRGNGGSGATNVGAAALADAATRLVAELRQIAARKLDLAAEEVAFEDGVFRDPGSNRTLSLAELAAGLPADADGAVATAQGVFRPAGPTFPNGLHVAEVEIDPETGARRLTRYTATEDLGRVLNRALVEGQIHGGVAQGVGQALGEALVYDAEGQLQSGSFMDYAMPRANDLSAIRFASSDVPTQINPLGVKGVGEAGTVGSLSAVMNAVNDALAPLGVRHLDMPATPQRIWAAIRDAGGETAERAPSGEFEPVSARTI